MRLSKAQYEELDAALIELTAAYAPITVRGVFYRAVAAGLVPKDENRGYRVVQRRLVKLREEGAVPYGEITDGSRAVYGYHRYRGAEHFASTVKMRYRQDYWAGSDEYVEIWIEKDTMRGVLAPVVIDEWGLDLYITRGFGSHSYLQEAAEDIESEDRPVFVYLLTDFDPYGMNIADKVQEWLEDRTFADVHVERIAVTPEQIEALSLPTRPTKRRRRGPTRYELAHGSESVELDAMPPDALRSIVSARIEQHMDRWTLQQMRMVERQERQGLAELLSGGGGAE